MIGQSLPIAREFRWGRTDRSQGHDALSVPGCPSRDGRALSLFEHTRTVCNLGRLGGQSGELNGLTAIGRPSALSAPQRCPLCVTSARCQIIT